MVLAAVADTGHGVDPTNSGKSEYGAGVTPRNTVLAGAVASTVFVLVTVLYEYSFVGDVRYSMNKPVVKQGASSRPAMEMIMTPLSINAAEPSCRVQAVPLLVYCAMLLVNVATVSVAHIEVVLENTNPYGRVEVPTNSVPGGTPVVGKPLNATNPALASDPAFEPSVQYRVVAVATREPVHKEFPLPTHPEKKVKRGGGYLYIYIRCYPRCQNSSKYVPAAL